MKLKVFIILVLLFAYLVSNIKTFAQSSQLDVKFRLAQSYERSGDLETALKLYEEIYSKDSTNVIIFDALRRLYTQLKLYNQAINLLERKIKSSPNDFNLLAQLGTLYVRNSEESKADEVWNRALSILPNNEMPYRIVAQAMVESRMFEKAIATYEQGRIACGNPILFTIDLASLHSNLMNYKDATREYLNYLRHAPNQLGYIQSRIAGYVQRAHGLEAAISVVNDACIGEPNNILFQQLLAWLYMEGKNFEKAFAVYQSIDTKTKASGREVFTFAERALNEKAYDIASKAYMYIIKEYPAFPLIAQTKFGYARSLEESISSKDTLLLFGFVSPFQNSQDLTTESEQVFKRTIEAYKRIAVEHSTTEVAARSLLRIAHLHFKKFFNLDEAIKTLEQLQKEYTRFPTQINEGMLMLSEIQLTSGNISASEDVLFKLTKTQNLPKHLKDKAEFLLAKISFYNGNLNDALERVKELTKNASADITNDALSLQYFLEENIQQSPEALKAFAKAEFLNQQRKLSEAILAFEQIAQTYKSAPLIDQTMMAIGDIYTQMQRYSDAINTYEKMLTDFPESILLDQIIMKIGTVYQYGIKDKQKSLSVFQLLLEKFPKSIYANEARKRIRELRGENI